MDRVPGRCLLVTLLVLSVAPTAASAAERAGSGGRYVADELIVRFKPGVSGAERADARRDHGATVERGLRVPRAQLLDLDGSDSVRAAEAAFEGDPRVEYAEPNYLVRAESNDQYFSDLWGLENLGALGGILDADIDAPEAWAVPLTPGDVVVAVVDTGVALGHPDLDGRLVAGHDFVDDDTVPADLALDDPNTQAVDPVAHGTHVAGTVGAVRDNGIGVAGVTSQVDIMPLRALDFYGNGTNADVADAFAYAGAQGARIVNASLSSASSAAVIRDAIAAATNTLFVAAAGNSGSDNDATPRYPCNEPLDNVLCVAASDRTDARASFSNYGNTSVDIAAPGVSTMSTYAEFNLRSQELFDAGALPPGWVADPAWSVSGPAASQGNGGLGIARGPSDADSSATMAAVDLTGSTGCQVLFDLRMDVAGTDEFRVEAQLDGGGWSPVLTRTADTAYVTTGGDIPSGGSVQLRFRYVQQGAGTGDGVAVDFVEVYCTDTAGAAGYKSLSGTSMATPHVAGAAALVLAQTPAMTPVQVKDRLLATGDVSACWTNRTVSGRRLNVARALGANVGPGPTETSCGGGGAAAAPQPQPSAPAPIPPPTTGAQPPTTDGSGGEPTPTAVDSAAPVVGLAVGRIQRLDALLRGGLRAGVRCSERCTVSARLYARTASGRPVLVGRSARVTSRGGRVSATVRLSREGRAFLRRGPRRQTLTLSVSASDAAGNVRKLRRRVSLRR